MKKFLTAISLMLVALMVIAIPAVAVEDDVYDTLDKPEGINVYYATNVSGSEPMIDGVIEVGEYGDCVAKITAPFVASNKNWGSGAPQFDDAISAIEVTYPEIASEYFEIYFAYDEEYIYIALNELGPLFVDDGDEFLLNNVPYRSNYRFQLGFEPDNVLNWFQFEGFQTNNHWTTLNYFDNGSKRTHSTLKTYNFVEEFIMTKFNVEDPENPIAMGDMLSVNGNANYTSGRWGTTMEYKINKAAVAEVWNACYGTDYNDVANAMWFGMTTSTYKAQGAWQYNEDGTIKTNDAGKQLENYDPAIGQYFNWFGFNDISGQTGEYEDYGVSESSTKKQIFDLVIFGEESDDIILADPFPPMEEETDPETTEPATTEPAGDADVTEPAGDADVTEPATTEPAATEPATTEPATTEPATTEAADNEEEETTKKTETTKAPETTAEVEEKKGCGSSVSVAGIALVAALGTCTVFVAKKKED